jgi:hypothetical protein
MQAETNNLCFRLFALGRHTPHGTTLPRTLPNNHREFAHIVTIRDVRRVRS